MKIFIKKMFNIKDSWPLLALGIISLCATSLKAAAVPQPPSNMPELSPDKSTLGFYDAQGVFTPVGAQKSAQAASKPAPAAAANHKAATPQGGLASIKFDPAAARSGLKKTTPSSSAKPAPVPPPPPQPKKTVAPKPARTTTGAAAAASATSPSPTKPKPPVHEKSPALSEIVTFIEDLKLSNMLFYHIDELKSALRDIQREEGLYLNVNLEDQVQLTKFVKLLQKQKDASSNYIPSSRKTSSTPAQPSSLSVSLSQNEKEKQIDTFMNTIRDEGMLTNFAQQATTINDIKNYLESLLANGKIIGLDADDLLDENSDLRQTLDTFVLSLQQPEPATSTPPTPPAVPTFLAQPNTPIVTSNPPATPQAGDLLAEIRKGKKFKRKVTEEDIEKEKQIRRELEQKKMALLQKVLNATNNNDDDNDDDDDQWDDSNDDQDDDTTPSSTTTNYYKQIEVALKRNHTIDLEAHPSYSQLITEQKNILQRMRSAFILKDQIENDLKNNIYIDIIKIYPQFQTLPKDDQLDVLSQQIRGFLNADASYNLTSYPLWDHLTPLIRLSLLVKQNKEYNYQTDPDWKNLTDHNKKQILQLAKPKNKSDMLAAQRAAFGLDEDYED